MWAQELKWYSVGGAIDRFASDIAALEQALEEARAERDRLIDDYRNEVARAYVAETELARVTEERDAVIRDNAGMLSQLIAERDAARLTALKECCSLAEYEAFRAADCIQALIDAEESKVNK